MALYHIHNAGKHMNKKAADEFQIKTRSCVTIEMKTFSCTAENTNFERRMTVCRNLCFSNSPV